MPRPLTIYRLDTVGYEEALALQRRVLDEHAKSLEDAGTLILLEHPPVITIGRSGTAKNILASAPELERAGVRVFETNRGGDVTYHGPDRSSAIRSCRWCITAGTFTFICESWSPS